MVLLVAGFRFDTYYIFYSSWILVGGLDVALRTSYDSVTALVLDALNFERRALLVGAPALVAPIAESLERAESRQGVPYRVVGRHQLTAGLGAEEADGEAAALRQALDPDAVDEVILAGWSGEDAPVLELLDICRRRGIPVRLAPTTAELLTHSVQAVPAPGLPLFDLRPPVLGGAAFLTKRAFDLVVGGADRDPGGADPRDRGDRDQARGPRAGDLPQPARRRGGARVHLLQAAHDAHGRRAASRRTWRGPTRPTGPLFKIREDPRVTRVGKVLRRLSIDELPQLWNVLRGEMSLVGPRPLPRRDYERLDGLHKKRYLVLPGLTGLWQVSGRSDLSFDELVRLDFYYIETWSIWLDLTIMARTIPVVLGRRGAY